MTPATDPDEAEFEAQLSAFQADVATVTRGFYTMAAINHLASQDAALLAKLNHAPDFWNLVQAASQTTLFIALGRIFDQNSDVRFTLDKLIGAAQKNGRAIFAADRLADRKRRESTNADAWLGDYLKGIYVPTPDDFRALRKVRDRYRQRFTATYRPIRHEVYAHGIATRAEAVELFAETRLVELQRIIRFLQLVGDGLWNLYHNGRNPMLRRRFPPWTIEELAHSPDQQDGTSDQRIIVEAIRTVMEQLRRA
ncbi:MAG TPA: hypothetical protein VNS22_13500 [Geminicoccus sp.]|uniref:AbiU2 domain-containing protein n=1 Tax=Geminicoccus sp. TaxID=2024832 RepID=UPI002CCCA2FA|nr:hypothetical protein [Geminicoccus sp.]HWL69383.1 hypothetical protein [Geminicoccus sp.]